MQADSFDSWSFFQLWMEMNGEKREIHASAETLTLFFTDTPACFLLQSKCYISSEQSFRFELTESLIRNSFSLLKREDIEQPCKIRKEKKKNKKGMKKIFV